MIAAAGALSLIVSLLVAAPAEATNAWYGGQHGCGAKYVTLHFTNSGTVELYGSNVDSQFWANSSYIGSYGTGSHAYTSGYHTWSYGFGVAPGTVTKSFVTCDSFF